MNASSLRGTSRLTDIASPRCFGDGSGSRITTASVSRCQIDRRSSHATTQPSDRTGRFAFQQSYRGDHLAAFLLLTTFRGGLAASLRGYSPTWPIEIWYCEDPTQ